MYLIFGILTTFVNFGSFALFEHLLGTKHYLISNILSFVFATSFAFITNKQFVFESKSWKSKIWIKEAISFVSARIGTFLIVEELGLLVSVEMLGVDQYYIWIFSGTLIAKICLAFLAVLVNYILSKWFIFNKK